MSAAELKAERLAILDALLAADRERAATLLRDHLERGRAAVLEAQTARERPGHPNESISHIP